MESLCFHPQMQLEFRVRISYAPLGFKLRLFACVCTCFYVLPFLTQHFSGSCRITPTFINRSCHFLSCHNGWIISCVEHHETCWTISAILVLLNFIHATSITRARKICVGTHSWFNRDLDSFLAGLIAR